MKELNELVDLAKKVLSPKDAFAGVDAKFEWKARANPTAILAIAKAYLALEQREEAAKAKWSEWKDECVKAHGALMQAQAELAEEKRINSKLREDRAGLARECNAFEVKLAELEKQQPVAWTSQANLDTLKSEPRKTLEFMTGDKSIYSNPVPLFSHPAPAINLAELVPGEMPVTNDKLLCDNIENNGWNLCRAAILRNIEEQSQ